MYCKFGNFCDNFIFPNGVKDIFATLKIRDKGMIYLYQSRQIDLAISQGFYFHETSYMRSFTKKKKLEISELIVKKSSKDYFASVDSLRPSQQFFSHMIYCLPDLNQYYAVDFGSESLFCTHSFC